MAEAVCPSQALIENASSRPLAFKAGRQLRLSPAASNVLPGTTAVPLRVNVPLVTPSIRKDRVALSTSDSSAAAARAAYVMV